MNFEGIAAIAMAYLLGSISFSFLAGKLLKGIDIRQHGSGNAGATNTLRVIGKGPAAAVLLLDVLKGIAAILIGRWLGDGNEWIPFLCGLAVIVGHNWPVFFGFKGGKGIATTIGVLVMLSFLPALFAGLFAIAAIFLTRYVSLGSLIFTALTPFFIGIMHFSINLLWVSLLIAALAFYRHRTNIVKLATRRENKLRSRH